MGASIRVVVVNYNAGPLLAECVRAVMATPIQLEMVVVDNGSSDGSLEPIKNMQEAGLIVVENADNPGFAKACNQGLRDWQGEFALLLNPDCLAGPQVIPGMLDILKATPRFGMAGCLILNPDGSEQNGCRRLAPTPQRVMAQLFGRVRINLAGLPLPDLPVEVEAISGAFMLVRREAVKAVGLLDEGYFMHWEDLDWCFRFRQAGWPILFEPRLSIIHAKGGCSQRRPVRVAWHKHVGMVRYFEKYFRNTTWRPLLWMIYLGLWTRFLLQLPVAAWRAIGSGR